MRYRNKITGIEFETSCIISGEDFEPVVKASAKKETPKEEKVIVETSKPKTTTTTKRAKK